MKSDLFDISLLSGHRAHAFALKPLPPNRLEGKVTARQREVCWLPNWVEVVARIEQQEQRLLWSRGRECCCLHLILIGLFF